MAEAKLADDRYQAKARRREERIDKMPDAKAHILSTQRQQDRTENNDQRAQQDRQRHTLAQ